MRIPLPTENALASRIGRLGRLIPAVAGAQAFRRFCTPALSSYRSADHDTLVERARFHLRSALRQRVLTTAGAVQTYVLEPEVPSGPSVLLVHGWTGEAAFMTAFAEHLRRRGFRPILLDLPAHGLSEGRSTTLMDCAHAVREVADVFGPVRFAVGHSIGGMAILVAAEGRQPMPRAHPFDALVLISIPDRFADVTRRFGREEGLSPAGLRVFERRLERLACRPLEAFTACNLLTAIGGPVQLIHSRDDDAIPFADAERIASSVEIETAFVDGLGHRMILYAPPVVRAATAFLLRHR